MKKLLNRLVLVTALFVAPNLIYAQSDSTATAIDSLNVADSIKNETLVAKTIYLQQLDSIKQADSVKRANLEAQISALKTTDNLKKEELLAELQKIKDDELARISEQKRQIDSLKKFVKGFPVAPFVDTICYVYAKIGPFTPQVRAANIEQRIIELEDDVFFHKDSINVIESEETVDLLYRDFIVLSLTDKDALWMGHDKLALGNAYKDKIAASIKAHRKATSFETLLKEIGLALVVVIFVIILIKYLNKGARWLKLKVHQNKGGKINGIKIRNYELFTADSEVRAIYVVMDIIRWFLILLTIYLMLPVLFSIFPWTKNIAGVLLSYILTPLRSILSGVWNYLPNLFTIFVIAVVFRYVFKALHFFKVEVQTGALKIPGFYPEWAMPTYQLMKVLLVAFMIIVIFPYLPGSDSAVFQGVSVFLGVIFTFGSSSALSNVMAGLVLTYMRAFKLGDRVKIGDVTGDIIEKSLLVTKIRTIKNEDITVPNSTVMSSYTTNYSSAAQHIGLIVHSTVTIGYDVPWEKVHSLLIEAAQETELIQEEPIPFVLQTSLDDYYVSYQINAYTKESSKQAVIYSQLHQNIQDKFNKAGVEIMSPHYRAVRDGHQTTIPTDYLPEDYITPSFRVDNTNGNDKKS